MGELFFIASLIIFLVLPFVLMNGRGRVYWLITMGTIGFWIGAMELFSKFLGGDRHTISQYFWEYSLNHPTTAWIIIGMLLIGWLALLLHLAWKLITKQRDNY